MHSSDTTSCPPDALADRLTDSDVTVVDVRSRFMFRESAIPGALNIPFGPDFADRLAESCPSDASLVVLYGQHAEKAHAALANDVEADVRLLEGGLEAWRAAGHNVRVSPLRVPKDWREGTT